MILLTFSSSVIFILQFLVRLIKCSEEQLVTGSSDSRLGQFQIVSPQLKSIDDNSGTRTSRGLDGLERTAGNPVTRMEVSFTAFEQNFTLDLVQNLGLFTSHYIEKHDNLNGSSESTRNVKHCFYHGSVRGKKRSTVSLSTCDGIEGFIHDGKDSFYIEPTRNALHQHLHLFYRLKDLELNGFHDSNEARPNFDNFIAYSNRHFENTTRLKGENFGRSRRYRRDIFTETKYVELMIINDNSQFESNGKNLTRTNLRAKQIVNLVDAIFKPLNIRVALVAMETWTVADKIKADEEADTYLSNLVKYREKKLLRVHPNDNTQLLTGISLKDSVRGKAQIMSICTRESAGLIQDYSPNAAFTANTFAHELGHAFGMYHDEDLPDCVCKAKSSQGCVMSAHVGREPTTVFSNCSLKGLRKTLERGLGTCLFNVPKVLFGGPVCGDGIKGHGEECDCGTLQECTNKGNTCCDHMTCKLRAHAQCDSGVCCEKCNFKKRGTLCREKVNECDIPEFCTGQSGICPSDVYVHNGYPCSNNTAYCYWGKCPTHYKQCQYLWGSTAVSAPDMCYKYHNSQKNKFGHCKQTKGGTYVACKLRDAKCGKLWCLANATLPVIGVQRSVMKSLWPFDGKTISCKGSSLQMGLDVPEPTMTLEGTKCAHGKLCLKHRCVSVKELLKKGPSCSQNCSKHGVCSNLGKCHCFYPWTGIHCSVNSLESKTTLPTKDMLSKTQPITTEYFSTEKPSKTTTIGTQSPTAFKGIDLLVVYITVPLFVVALVVGLLLVLCRFTHVLDRLRHKHRKFVVYSKKSDVRAKLRVKVI